IPDEIPVSIRFHYTSFIMSVRKVSRKVRFLFLIESINHQPLWPARQVRLNWYRFKQKKQQVLKAGESWQFQVKLRAPFGLENFIGFNYRRWLYQHSIQATGLVIDRYGKKGINGKLSSSHVFNLQQYRQKIAWFLERIDLHNTALIKALVLGERAEVKRSVRNLLQQTGTAHLLAVSGLHIGLIVTFTFFLIRGVLLWAPGMSRKYQNSGYALFIAAIVSLLVALCYSALAGFSVATLRACLMTVCVLLAFLCRRVVPIWALYQYALVGVVILFPLSVLSIGFWLSFLSVGVLIFVCTGRLAQTKLQKYLKPQWALLIALAPLSLAYFFNMPLIGLLANLVAIPWVGFLVLPLLLLGLLFIPLSYELSWVLFHCADLQITWLINVLLYLDRWQLYIQPFYGVPTLVLLVFSFLGALILLTHLTHRS
ncbi:ComEC/Rec2 family competence protein, partial [Piscirickettsia salmonis]